jgi:hypothetical protein
MSPNALSLKWKLFSDSKVSVPTVFFSHRIWLVRSQTPGCLLKLSCWVTPQSSCFSNSRWEFGFLTVCALLAQAGILKTTALIHLFCNSVFHTLSLPPKIPGTQKLACPPASAQNWPLMNLWRSREPNWSLRCTEEKSEAHSYSVQTRHQNPRFLSPPAHDGSFT